MNKKFKTYKILSHLGAILYVILGSLTIGSIVNGRLELYINLIMGGFFIIMGYYLYLKAKSTIRLITNIENLSEATLNSISRFLFFEKIFVIMYFLLGIILLSGAISRVFGENLPIFG
ncbi:MAG: hypothetical protein ACWIPI_00575 [Polaribacter sp.]